MTIQEQYTRALKGAVAARESLRLGGNDMSLDHWAARLTFWKDEAKRLQAIAEQDGGGLLTAE